METGFDMLLRFLFRCFPWEFAVRRISGPMSLSLGYPVRAGAGKHCSRFGAAMEITRALIAEVFNSIQTGLPWPIYLSGKVGLRLEAGLWLDGPQSCEVRQAAFVVEDRGNAHGFNWANPASGDRTFSH
jgi:hypothetical protein